MTPSTTPRLPCPTCGTAVPPGSDVCGRCGMPAASTRSGVKAAGSSERSALTRRKGKADLMFLVGLVVGGPVMTVGGHFRAGLFLVLAGGFASVLHRYARSSLGGSVALGAAGALLIAVLVVDAPLSGMSDAAGERARAEYVAELARSFEPDGLVEARGPGLVTAWFLLPDEPDQAVCGTVPGEEIRTRLRELGFRRVVVADRATAGGVCSFQP